MGFLHGQEARGQRRRKPGDCPAGPAWRECRSDRRGPRGAAHRRRISQRARRRRFIVGHWAKHQRQTKKREEVDRFHCHVSQQAAEGGRRRFRGESPASSLMTSQRRVVCAAAHCCHACLGIPPPTCVRRAPRHAQRYYKCHTQLAPLIWALSACKAKAEGDFDQVVGDELRHDDERVLRKAR